MLIVSAPKDDMAAVGGQAVDLNLPACKSCIGHLNLSGYVVLKVVGGLPLKQGLNVEASDESGRQNRSQ
jgi:hypothetical protein